MSAFRLKEAEFETVYRMYADLLYRLAYSYLGNREDAQDVVQDVFVKYFCGIYFPMDREKERAWLITVTANRCRDLLRRKSYRLHDSLEDVAETLVAENPETHRLMDFIHRLPEKYKDTILLHYFEGYSVEETAKILGMTSSAVKMRLKRGRTFLKEELEKE